MGPLWEATENTSSDVERGVLEEWLDHDLMDVFRDGMSGSSSMLRYRRDVNPEPVSEHERPVSMDRSVLMEPTGEPEVERSGILTERLSTSLQQDTDQKLECFIS